MPTLAVSAVGLDRPGIIAGVAERLAAHGANVTDSRMAILRGHFAMTLIVEGAGREALEADLRDLSTLETFSVTEVAEAAANPRSEPTHVVSVHGAEIGREGCLSIPELTGNVRRATHVTVEAEGLRVEAEGFEARALQHEIDHLDGLLFLDRVESLEADVFRRKR